MKASSWGWFSFLFVNQFIVLVLSQKSFDGFRVIRMDPDTDGQVDFLRRLAYNFDTDVAFMDKVDFWRRPKTVNQSVDLMVSPEIHEDISMLLSSNEVKHRVMIPDVQALIQAEKVASLAEASEWDLTYKGKRYMEDPYAFFKDYHRLSEIHEYMNDLASLYPQRVKLRSLGKSSEGRDLLMWVIGNNRVNSSEPKDIIWIDSGIHAREWISPATGLFLATHVS